MPQLARLNGRGPLLGLWVRSIGIGPIQAALGDRICKRYFWLRFCSLRRETLLISRHDAVIPQDHIFTLAQGTQSLGALDVAQSSRGVHPPCC